MSANGKTYYSNFGQALTFSKHAVSSFSFRSCMRSQLVQACITNFTSALGRLARRPTYIRATRKPIEKLYLGALQGAPKELVKFPRRVHMRAECCRPMVRLHTQLHIFVHAYSDTARAVTIESQNCLRSFFPSLAFVLSLFSVQI